MVIIPAIDILGNRIVRLRKGDFNQVEYYQNTPLQQAEVYENSGFEWLHMVDLEGSKSGSISVKDTIKEIKARTRLKIEFGGGIRNINTVDELINTGVDRVIIGSMSVQNKNEFEKIAEKFGSEKIVVASDIKNELIMVKGWTEETSVSLYEHINYCLSLGLTTFLCTDISKDGMLTGTNIDLYKKILNKFQNIKLIASGGIKDIEDVRNVKNINAYGVIVGKAIYENKINLKELAEIGK
jgi:phosphoribosylformimino-5-aminoimidazole carboxamide ribotide isomerase